MMNATGNASPSGSPLTDGSSLVLRLTLAGVLLPHGLQQSLGLFGGYGFVGTMGFYTHSAGLSYGLALTVIAVLNLGPVLLLAGLGTRLAALACGLFLAGAMLTAHLSNGFFMNWYGTQHGEGYEYHLLGMGLALALILQGGGRFALDRILFSCHSPKS